MLELNIFKNNNQNAETFGKWYARVEGKEQLSVHDMAKHMAKHNTPFSAGTIEGILTDFVECVREQCLQGNTVKIENLAIFKASVKSNPCSRYGVMRATIGSKSVKVGGQTVETGNAVKSMRLVAQATGQYTTAELNKDATLGWTKKAQEAINADKAAMQQAQGGNG